MINIFILFLIASVMMYGNFTSAVRGGYDNNHDFAYIELDSYHNDMLFSYKEISPIFIKDIIDKASGYSLKAILNTNRIIPLLSMLLFFAALKYAGAGSAGGLAGTALLFLNFHTFLNASAFSTTSVSVFIFISAITAFISCLRKIKIEYWDLFCFFSSSVLSVMCRVEQTPVIFLMSISLMLKRINRLHEINIKNPFTIIFTAGLSLITLCFCFQLKYPSLRLFHLKSPLTNFNMQIIQENLSLVFSENPVYAFPSQATSFSVLCAVVLLFLAAGIYCLKIRCRNCREFLNDPHFLFFLILLYNIVLYYWQDIYPLHFMRHRILMFIPFAALCGFSLKAIIEAAEKKRLKI